jgi:hypothetical protein
MKKAIFPIEVELWYETIEERDAKINILKEFLTEIIKSKDRFNDMKKLQKYLSIIKWTKQPLKYYVFNILLSILFVTIISVLILWISIHNWNLVSSTYLWWSKWFWYYLIEGKWEEKLEFWEFLVNGCNDIACNTNKWVVLRRYIDYYSVF